MREAKEAKEEPVMTYGIGRVPADVDQAREAQAELEAAELMAAAIKGRRRSFAPTGTTEADPDASGPCYNCGADGYWNSGAGSYLCDRYWDEY